MSVRYLTLEEILVIHHDQIESYGGSHGIRDLNLLLSALFRPASSFDGEDLYPDIFTKAAVLLQSLMLNHAFIDGNKRTATISLARFLFINGFHLKAEDKDLVNFILDVESKKFEMAKIVSWVEHNTKRL